MLKLAISFLALVASLAVAEPPDTRAPDPASVTIRVAAFNLGDVRTSDLDDPGHPRLRALAEVIQRLRPNVILLSEIAWDNPDAPGADPAAAPGRNGQRFADSFLARPQADHLRPLRFKAFMAPVNTGMPSSLDLDRSGEVVSSFPPLPPAPRDQMPPPPTAKARAYGNDCWGFGAFPGQYGMALLVDERLVIELDKVRTFRLFPWHYMPGAVMPRDEDDQPWYGDEAQRLVRLSSKSHWDVPILLPNGSTIHFLCSHPTPPVFDGPERRNARRNRDEIRFWADYTDNASYIVDDNNTGGGLERDRSFIILGDLNADPERGESFRDPIGSLLCASRRINCVIIPKADVEIDGLAPADTATFGLRVDYILPSHNLGIAAAGIYRHPPMASAAFPSDHYPVWMDIVALPAAEP